MCLVVVISFICSSLTVFVVIVFLFHTKNTTAIIYYCMRSCLGHDQCEGWFPSGGPPSRMKSSIWICIVCVDAGVKLIWLSLARPHGFIERAVPFRAILSFTFDFVWGDGVVQGVRFAPCFRLARHTCIKVDPLNAWAFCVLCEREQIDSYLLPW